MSEDEFVKAASQALLDSVGPENQLVVPAHIPLHTWVMLYDARDVPHAVPTGDMFPHYALNCACQPLLLDEVQQHNSFDQREYFENRLRKPS